MPITISGTCYGPDGTTPLVGVPVRIAVSHGNFINGEYVDDQSVLATTDANGNYTSAALQAVVAGETIGVTLFSISLLGATVTSATGNNQTGINVFQNALTIRSDNGSQTANGITGGVWRSTIAFANYTFAIHISILVTSSPTVRCLARHSLSCRRWNKISSPLFPSISRYVRKLPETLLALHDFPSVHRRIPASRSSQTNTDPDFIDCLSFSDNLRCTRGSKPSRHASKSFIASAGVRT